MCSRICSTPALNSSGSCGNDRILQQQKVADLGLRKQPGIRDMRRHELGIFLLDRRIVEWIVVNE